MTAVYVHGLAADIALKNESAESILITDVIAKIRKAFILTSKKIIKKTKKKAEH